MARLMRRNAFRKLANITHLAANQGEILRLALLRGKRVFA
jgi:hypothetical protein